MIVELITELSVIGVFSRGVANEERIVLRATEPIQMGQYGLMIGVRLGQGLATPIRDNLLWFGDGILGKGDWVFVYTGPGKGSVTDLPNTQEKLYSIHWGRETTFLSSPDLVPILFRVDAVQITDSLLGLPQSGK
jgi:hypothetical protein